MITNFNLNGNLRQSAQRSQFPAQLHFSQNASRLYLKIGWNGHGEMWVFYGRWGNSLMLLLVWRFIVSGLLPWTISPSSRFLTMQQFFLDFYAWLLDRRCFPRPLSTYILKGSRRQSELADVGGRCCCRDSVGSAKQVRSSAARSNTSDQCVFPTVFIFN